MTTGRPTRRAALAGLAITAALALGPTLATAQERLSVVATTGMIADAAREVGGDLVEVEALMGPGIDPHSYRQTRTDIVAMTRADLVLWHGLYLEAQLEGFLQELAEDHPVVAVAESLPRNLLIGHDDYDDKFDPHVWMNPALWSRVVLNVRDAMIDVHPEGAATFRTNAEAHLAELDALTRYTADVLSSVPAEARVLLTSHDAFNYFGATYGFEVIGIQASRRKARPG